MSNKPPVNLSAMNRAFFEGLNSGARLELLCRLHAMTVELAERLAKNSTNSSKPPSSDSPFGGLPSKGEGGQKDDVKGSAAAKPWTPPSAPPRRPGKQPGAKGKWRCEALTGERTENHYPNSCGICGATLELWHDNRGYSGHFVLDLERLPSGIRVACVLHRYHVRTRKSFGLMTRKLSVTESRKRFQFLGTLSRKKSSVASANCPHVA